MLSWTLRLPDATPLRLGFSYGLGDGASSEDGVDFRVLVNGMPYWQATTAADQWHSGALDLGRWKGQNILLELVTDSRSNYNFDWAYWADLALSASVVNCSYGVPASTSIGAPGGSFSVNVTATNTCSWSATSHASWITVADGSGSGNGTAALVAAPNTGALRSGTVTIAGHTLTLTQAANTPPACAPGTTSLTAGAHGGATPLAVTGPGNCSWTASTSAAWMTLSPDSGTGPGSVSIAVTPNFSKSARTATMTVAGHAVVLTQNGGAAPALFGRPGAALAHVQIVPFNFNGDAREDTILYNDLTGGFSIRLGASGGTFVDGPSGYWSAGWRLFRADFNDDGLDDLFLYQPANGHWYKVINDGNGGLTYFHGQWSAGWQVYIVDFDGDHHSDVFLYRASGQWYRCRSTGDGTGEFDYASGTWNAGWQIFPADFNHDGKTDLFIYHPQKGWWYQVLNDGTAFSYSPMGKWSAGWTVLPGDFNGDGRTDVFLTNAAGQWVVVTTQSNLSFTYSPTRQWSRGWTMTPGDFDGDGKTDLLLYNASIGWWYEAISTGAGDFGYFLGQWSARWEPQAVDLNGDDKSDVLLYNRISGQWYQAITTVPGSFTYGTGFWGPS